MRDDPLAWQKMVKCCKQDVLLLERVYHKLRPSSLLSVSFSFSVYLDGPLVTEKKGKLVDSLTEEDFCCADKVFSNPQRTVITSKNEGSDELKTLVNELKKEKEKDTDNKELGRRLGSLTSGMVTVKVGGSTPIEVREKIFRYEDAINATRSAIKYGYLLSGTPLVGSYYIQGTLHLTSLCQTYRHYGR